MKQRHQGKAQTNVLLMMDDTALATGIEGILSQNENLHVNRFSPESLGLAEKIGKARPDVVVLSPMACSLQSPECLIGLLSGPDVLKVMIVNPVNNLVQVFNKQEVMLIDKENFAKLF